MKPETFLELLWGFIHQDCACSETVPVASRPAIAVRRSLTRPTSPT